MQLDLRDMDFGSICKTLRLDHHMTLIFVLPVKDLENSMGTLLIQMADMV